METSLLIIVGFLIISLAVILGIKPDPCVCPGVSRWEIGFFLPHVMEYNLQADSASCSQFGCALQIYSFFVDLFVIGFLLMGMGIYNKKKLRKSP